jgi:threonine aldolase
VGSVLCGSEEFIGKARKWRKMVGGGMRQAGVLAAAGLVALDNMVERLADDHANARRLAAGLANIDGLTVEQDGIQTNIVIFEVDREKVGDAREVIAALREDGVLVSHSRDQALRMVTHRHIASADVDEALARVNGTVRRLTAAA